jgi:hypothetical protein
MIKAQSMRPHRFSLIFLGSVHDCSLLFTLAVGDFLQRQRQEQMLRRLNENNASEPEPRRNAC